MGFFMKAKSCSKIWQQVDWKISRMAAKDKKEEAGKREDREMILQIHLIRHWRDKKKKKEHEDSQGI